MLSDTRLLLTQATSPVIHQYIAQASTKEAQAAVQHLETHRPDVANAVLCHVYDVTVYLTGDTCFRDAAAPHERTKWFVAVNAESEFDNIELIETIPLADSEEEAYALAVKFLGLSDRLFQPGRQLSTC